MTEVLEQPGKSTPSDLSSNALVKNDDKTPSKVEAEIVAPPPKTINDLLLDVLTSIQKNLAVITALPKDDILTVQQLAERWKLSITQIKTLRRADAIPYLKIGGALRFSIKEIELWEKRNTNRAS